MLEVWLAGPIPNLGDNKALERPLLMYIACERVSYKDRLEEHQTVEFYGDQI